MYWVASFYRFQAVDDPERLRGEVSGACERRSLLGTVLIAEEGVNAALAGPRHHLAELIAECFPELPDASVKWTEAPSQRRAFRRLMVRTKPEVVTFGRPQTAAEPVGGRLDVAAWHRLLGDPDVPVVDVRNDYETSIGAFRGALRPNIASFGEFADYARRELDPAPGRAIGIYCTGGIRCEKAATLLREQGFAAVHQLEGGILRYLQETRDAAERSGHLGEAARGQPSNAFEGECFVFDGRVSLNAQLRPGGYRLCRACGWPMLATAETCENAACSSAPSSAV